MSEPSAASFESSTASASSVDHDRRNAWFCALLVALAFLISWPIAEVGRNDDWSYAFSSWRLAQTGHLTYNGWSTAMLGAQAYWGAAVIKLFGMKFTALRVSTLPFTCSIPAMLYLLARRLKAAVPVAMLSALTLGLSQMTIECVATFSTDLPGLFCFAFCLHQVVRALDPWRSARQVILPLLLAAFVGYCGGTIRQVYWLMPAVAFTIAIWNWRRELGKAAIAGALLLAVIGCALATEHWAHAQPYFITEFFDAMVKVFFSQPKDDFKLTIRLVMTLVLFSLPVTFAAWPVLRRPGTTIAIVLAMFVAIGAMVGMGRDALGPWLGNLVTEYGIMYLGQDAIGTQPQVIPDPLRVVLTLVCAAVLAAVVWAIVGWIASWRKGATHVDAGLRGECENGPRASCLQKAFFMQAGCLRSVHPILLITGLFAIGYTTLILFRGPSFSLSDRYTLPQTFMICLWLAPLISRTNGAAIRVGYAMMILVAVFGIAVTHDEFAVTRARLRAVDALTSHGVPRTAITAGVDYDAWTQLLQTGYVNDSRILNPPNQFVPHPRTVPEGKTDYWFWEWSPAVRPDFFVVDMPQQDLENIPGMTFRYTAWLPPFDRAAYVQHRPAGWVIPW